MEKRRLLIYLAGLIAFLVGLFFIKVCFFEIGVMLLIGGMIACWESIPLPKRKGDI